MHKGVNLAFRLLKNMRNMVEILIRFTHIRRKAEAEVAYLEVEWTSLLLEVRATKDKVSSLKS